MTNDTPPKSIVKQLIRQFELNPVASRTRSQIAASSALSAPDQPRVDALTEQFGTMEIDTPTKFSGGKTADPDLQRENDHLKEALKQSEEELKRKHELLLRLTRQKDDSAEIPLGQPKAFAFTKGLLSKYYRYAAFASIKSKGLTIYTAELERRTIFLSIFGIINYPFAWEYQIECPNVSIKLMPPPEWSLSNARPLFSNFCLRVGTTPKILIHKELLTWTSGSLKNSLRFYFVGQAMHQNDETDLDKRILTLLVLELAVFRHSQFSNPEAQYVALWQKLFEIGINLRLDFRNASTLELQMRRFESYGVDHRVDIVSYLIYEIGGISEKLIPICLTESSGHRIPLKFMDSKDFRKLACEMLGVYLLQLGLLKNADIETKKKIRVFGAFTSADQVQFCVMFGLFEEAENEDEEAPMNIVFQTLPHWRYELSHPTVCDQATCKYCQKSWDIDATSDLPDIRDIPSLSKEDKDNINVASDEFYKKGVGRDNDDGAGSVDPSSANKKQKPLNLDEATLFAKVVMAFGKEVASYSQWFLKKLEELGDRKMLGEPIQMPTHYQVLLPSSRDSHSQSTPGKPFERSPGRGHSYKTRSQGRELSDDELECVLYFANAQAIRIGPRIMTLSQKSACFKDLTNPDRVIVFKSLVAKGPTEKESKILSALKSCVNVVPIFGCHSGSSFSLLHLQKLSYRNLAEIESFPELTVACCAMLLDGITALTALKSAGILHRDISPSNFMFSWPDQRWKLLDFADACYVEDAKLDDPKVMKIIGTNDFIAPEILDRQASYSFCSDMFSMGETARFLGVQHAWDQFECICDDGDERDQFYGLLDALIFMTTPYPPRNKLSEIRQKVFKSLSGMLRFVNEPVFTHYNMEALNLHE